MEDHDCYGLHMSVLKGVIAEIDQQVAEIV